MQRRITRIEHEVLDPTEGFDDFKLFLDNVKAKGGGDIPEDIAEAMSIMTKMICKHTEECRQMDPPCINKDGKVDWQLLVYHVLDAPAHGYHDGDHPTQEERDRYIANLDSFVRATTEYESFEYHHFNVHENNGWLEPFCLHTQKSMIRNGYAASSTNFSIGIEYVPAATKLLLKTCLHPLRILVSQIRYHDQTQEAQSHRHEQMLHQRS